MCNILEVGGMRRSRYQSENKTDAPSDNYIHIKQKEGNLLKKTPQEQKMSETNFNCGSAYILCIGLAERKE